MLSCTYKRLIAMQTWPLLKNAALNIWGAIFFWIRIVEHDGGIVTAQFERQALQGRCGAPMTLLPVAVEPVKEIFAMPG